MSADTEVQAAAADNRAAHVGGRSFFLRYLGRELGRRATAGHRHRARAGAGHRPGDHRVGCGRRGEERPGQRAALAVRGGHGHHCHADAQGRVGAAKRKRIGIQIQGGPGSKPTVCINGKCKSGAQTIDNLLSAGKGTISYSEIAKIAKLAHVTAVAGGLALTDNRISISSNSASPPTQFSVQGVDLAHENLGPLSSGTLKSGRSLRASDASSYVALRRRQLRDREQAQDWLSHHSRQAQVHGHRHRHPGRGQQPS